MSPGKLRHSILIVDDDLLLLETVVELFQGEGWTVYQASTVKEAMRILKEITVDVILSDIRMPTEGGFELATQTRDLRAENKNVHLFFMTGFTDYPESVLLSLGARGIIYKPFHPGELLEKITGVLKK
ncbi:MAG: response regulator [Pseudobdellovibrionaceae bacterium]